MSWHPNDEQKEQGRAPWKTVLYSGAQLYAGISKAEDPIEATYFKKEVDLPHIPVPSALVYIVDDGFYVPNSVVTIFYDIDKREIMIVTEFSITIIGENATEEEDRRDYQANVQRFLDAGWVVNEDDDPTNRYTT